MEVFHRWTDANLDLVYLLYGLAFVIMGSILVASPRENSRFTFGRDLWLLAAYAFIHAPADFLDMRSVVRGSASPLPQDLLTFVSYLFLFEFGRRLLGLSARPLPWFILPVCVAGVLAGSAACGDFPDRFHVLTGYLIRFPAGLMAGVGFILYYRAHREELDALQSRRYFLAAGAAMAAWAFFCGLIRRSGDSFPVMLFDLGWFHDTFAAPVQLFRAICALLVAWSVWGILRLFAREAKERLNREIEERRLAQAEQSRLVGELQEALSNVRTLSGLLPICAGCKKIRDDQGDWNQIEHYIQKRTDTRFSHGMCPECAPKYFGKFAKP